MIKIENLRKTYQMGSVEVRALDGVSLTVEQGEYVAIIGASGSGKSTLMHILGLLDVPDAGTFEIDGTDVTKFSENELAAFRNRIMGFVFQQFNLLKRTSALENVGLPLIYARNGKKSDAANKMLDLVGLGDRISHHPNELSGGQQQRVAIARALVNNPSIIFADEPTGNLDSKSAKEIMEVMSELHAQGLTIILVTHDANVANHAQRIIEIKDGKILADFQNPDSPEVPRVGKVEQTKEAHAGFGHTLLEGITLVKQSIRSLAANKVRTALSALGIMIGVAAVIATVAVGNGAKAAVEESMSRLGSNLLMLYPQRRSRGGVSQGQGGSDSRLTTADVSAIRKEVEHVIRISPTCDGNAQLKAGNQNWSCRVQGVDPDYEAMRSYEPQLGRFFTDEEVHSRARVAVLGVTPVRELFGTDNPIGKQVKINRQTFTVIGVLPEKGSSGFRDYDDTAFVPLSTAMRRLFGKQYLDRVEIQIDEAQNMERAQTDILALVAQRHRTGTAANPFEIRNLAEIQDTMTETSTILSMLLSSIASIALIVGGIGIMNIMLVSVTERTREIGLRKALGARGSDIMSQFLIEALVISFFGGCLGIALGWCAGYLTQRFTPMTVLFTHESIYMAFGFSALIGVLFGIWPARKAAVLNPIDALRYE
ncbi:Macrolide export ATP-binding/permease protein MacB [Pontiella desulfatans]|uniref:Macrolide export ATP-binding/permease protein MacB n=1 Tax=Pontiella desulfatans TaxID=2750659 RepID=A0A6C2U735_PONDE|nr:ABC transporter permease [Pontiella desulfatans]VGO15830.1 Macrolide export ATP-binding/permease protein MacB [Pontiella desulfatans]